MIRTIGNINALRIFPKHSITGIKAFNNKIARTFSDASSQMQNVQNVPDRNKNGLTLEQLEAVRKELLCDIKTSEKKLLEDRYQTEQRLRDEIKVAENRLKFRTDEVNEIKAYIAYSSEELLTQVTYRVGIVLVCYATAAVTVAIYSGPITTVAI